MAKTFLALGLLVAMLILPLAAAQSYSGTSYAATSSVSTGSLTSSWFDSPQPLACPCQTIRLPLLLQNQLNQAVTVTAGLSTQDGDLSGFVQSPVNIESFETGFASIALSVSCTATQGPKHFAIQLADADPYGNQLASQQMLGSILVQKCSSLDLSPTTASLVCPNSQIDYNFILTNSGLNEQVGTLAVSGVKNSFYSIAPHDFDLQTGQSQVIQVVFSPPSGYFASPGDSLVVTATGNETNSQATVPLRSAYCPVNYNSTTLPPQTGPNKPPNRPGTTIPPKQSGSNNSSLAGFAGSVTGLVTRLNTPLSYIAVIIILAIAVVLLYFNAVHYSQTQTANQTHSTVRATRIAYAVENY